MWYVFPQLVGLGTSPMATRYGIRGLDEARAYLEHPVLGPRLREHTELVLRVPNRSAHAIFGWPDYLKFCSSMTLFDVVATGAVFARALERCWLNCSFCAAIARWLERLEYRTGVATVLVLTCAVALAFNTALAATFGEATAAALIRRLFLALSMAAVLLLYFASDQSAVAGDCRGAPAGAASTYPSALSVQQHHGRAVADSQRTPPRGIRARGHGGSVSRVDGRQPATRATARRSDPVQTVSRSGEAPPGQPPVHRMARR